MPTEKMPKVEPGAKTIGLHSPKGHHFYEENIVLIDKYDDGKIWTISLNRPERLNSFGGGMMNTVTEAFELFRDDPDARVAIIRGNGRAFCVGMDLKQMKEEREKAAAGNPYPPPPTMRAPHNLSPRNGLWKPTIAAMHGWCVAGGTMLGQQCDIRIGARSAVIGVPEVRWNLGAGWVFQMVHQIGIGHVLEMAIWGDEQWDAEHAYRVGYFNRVVDDDKLMDTCFDWARRAAKMAPRAVAQLKQQIYQGIYSGMSPDVAMGYGQNFGRGMSGGPEGMAGSADTLEGLRAFNERREAKFTGR